ncbi:MAG: hypothetical protein IT557_01615 [Alphaproteobacteria bacterium]|nr:hypothetical protein [Alphaproteobacteria bacterium]
MAASDSNRKIEAAEAALAKAVARLERAAQKVEARGAKAGDDAAELARVREAVSARLEAIIDRLRRALEKTG